MDLTAEGISALQTRSLLAPALVFAAGLLSSLGPCMAARVLALAPCVASAGSRRFAIVGGFLSGLTTGYASLGLFGTMLTSLFDSARFTYAIVSAGLCVAGLRMLVAATPEAHACKTGNTPVPASIGGVFLLGFSFALVVSPCCTPLIAATVVYTGQVGDPLYGAILLGLFGAGHGVPAALAATGSSLIVDRLHSIQLGQAAAITNATILIIIGAYYACLI